MPYGDGIAKINCFSLTDFHDFDFCQFRFYVRHHLDKKYEIEEGSEQMALGSLLDQSIKKFHKASFYGQPSEHLVNLVRAAAREMREQVESKPGPSFYTNVVPFLNEELILKAGGIFKRYYESKEGKIRQSLGDVGFCEWIIGPAPTGDPSSRDSSGQVFKLWGGPDTLELGDDGVAEVVDYKSRESLDKNFDMELMPKIYTLLVAKKLLEKGHKKARFVVRIWQDPEDESIFEEFDLNSLNGEEFLFRQKIDRILANKNIKFCNKPFCKACNSERKDEYLEELKSKHGLSIMSGEEFLER